jgi:hypothetical protein
LSGGAREGRWREAEEEGRGGKKRERKECGCFSFLLSLHPFQFLPLSLFKGVHWRSVADTCPVGDEWGEDQNVPRWNKRCVKLCVLSHPRFDFY